MSLCENNLQVRLERDPELLSKITTGEMMGDYWYDPHQMLPQWMT
jgi:hypothetical protein